MGARVSTGQSKSVHAKIRERRPRCARITTALLIAAVMAHGAASAEQTVGLFLNDAQSFDGFTLWPPRFGKTYLIDNQGRQVHTWDSNFLPGNTSYLLPNGNLIRAAKNGPPGLTRFTAGGFGGLVEEFTWDGTLIWSFQYVDETKRLHHDIEVLPNGNVLMIAWELKTAEEAIAAGRDPALLLDGELWPDHIIEVQPVGATGGNIVWEWHAWDHLIQDFDATKDNFGVVADHPELLDVNFVRTGATPGRADWMHVNAIDYNAELDQILIGSNFLNEFWIIDHSTTTEEAAGHTGGRYGKGGDFLYRWGNPQAYDRGGAEDQRLFGQHHPHWIEPGLPGAGNVLVFNNGGNRPEGAFSTVDEIVTPVQSDGSYPLDEDAAYGPEAAVWSYSDPNPTDLFSGGLSGAQRLPNGNTLICEGRGTTTSGAGHFIEVTSTGEKVWRYVNPVGGQGPIEQGATPAGDQNVFRVLRYPADYPGFEGRTLTPTDPVESFTAPAPVPTGAPGTTPLLSSRTTLAGDQIQVTWDAASCPAADYQLIYGSLANVGSYGLLGAQCGLGTTGSHDWLDVPAGSLFYLVVGVDSTAVYESSWGNNGAGGERNGLTPAGLCGTTTKVTSETCP